jgi:predicted nuclease with RNAse H fold
VDEGGGGDVQLVVDCACRSRRIRSHAVVGKGDACWVGVDVGAERKGFHIAALDANGVIFGPENVKSVNEVVATVVDLMPIVIGIDSPCCAADPGGRSRACERALASAVCGIRYTPDANTITNGGAYYAWIRNGFALYQALAAVTPEVGWKVIEVFPTASWTRLYKRRESARRTAWSRSALDALSLDGLPDRRLNQDDRDSIAAAWTARLRSRHDGIEWFGDLAVPSVTVWLGAS